jgi:hypothetical protein
VPLSLIAAQQILLTSQLTILEDQLPYQAHTACPSLGLETTIAIVQRKWCPAIDVPAIEGIRVVCDDAIPRVRP